MYKRADFVNVGFGVNCPKQRETEKILTFDFAFSTMVADGMFWLKITITLMLSDPSHACVEMWEFLLMSQWHQMMQDESHFTTTLKDCADLIAHLQMMGIAASDSVLLFYYSHPIGEMGALVIGRKRREVVHFVPNAVQ